MMAISEQLFNATIVSSAIVALNEIGLLHKLNENGRLNVSEFCAGGRIHKYPFESLLNCLASYKIVIVENDELLRGENFDDVYANRGYFTWLIKGYSYALTNFDSLLRSDTLAISNLKRDGAYIAKAGKEYGSVFVDPYFDRVIDEIQPKCLVDIGCGSASRIIQFAKNIPGVRAFGIDRDPGAVKQANESIKRAELNDRVEVVCSDIGDLVFNEKFADADVLCSFFMGHDLFPKTNCFSIFSNLNNVFPSAHTFLLCDTFRSADHGQHPIFTLGFEVTHAFMGQVIPTCDEWVQLFHDLGWKLRSSIKIEIPNSSIFSLAIK